MKTKVVVIGIGGASCSGKTLLAKHVARVLPTPPSSSAPAIIHQDDFAPRSELIPVHPVYGVQDWDDPETCMDWPELRSVLDHVRRQGELPPHHASHDHLNKQVQVGVDSKVEETCRAQLQALVDEHMERGVKLVWFIVDGFVLYWDKIVADDLDVKILMRVPHDVLKRRREERQVYVLQNPKDAEAGGVWVDPPDYFSNIVYPAYVKAHAALFERGDVEAGSLTTPWDANLTVLSPPEGDMSTSLQDAIDVIVNAVRNGAGTQLD